MYAHLGKQQTSPFSSFTSERTGLTKQPKEKRKQKEEEETLFFYAKLLCVSLEEVAGFFRTKTEGGNDICVSLPASLSLEKNKITRLIFCFSPPSPSVQFRAP